MDLNIFYYKDCKIIDTCIFPVYAISDSFSRKYFNTIFKFIYVPWANLLTGDSNFSLNFSENIVNCFGVKKNFIIFFICFWFGWLCKYFCLDTGPNSMTERYIWPNHLTRVSLIYHESTIDTRIVKKKLGLRIGLGNLILKYLCANVVICILIRLIKEQEDIKKMWICTVSKIWDK